MRAAATAQHDAGAASPQAKHVEIERENFWQTLGTRLPHELKSALSQIGSAEVTEGNANLAMSAAEANTVTHALKTLVEYRIQPWFDANGHRMQVPIINTGGEASDQGAVIAHVLLSPNEALTRPGVNADWMDVLIGSAFSYIAAASNRGFRSVAPVAELPGRGGVPARSANAAGYRATFGEALTNDYRATFLESSPELESRVVVHHAVPQRTLLLYPDEVTESEIHSLENLRGIPNELNSDVHLSQIAKEWNQFYKANPNATREQMLQKATDIDLKYGGQFKPPVGRGKRP